MLAITLVIATEYQGTTVYCYERSILTEEEMTYICKDFEEIEYIICDKSLRLLKMTEVSIMNKNYGESHMQKKKRKKWLVFRKSRNRDCQIMVR